MAHASVLERSGCILACTHFGNLDPACLSIVLPRRIDWLARTEFYRRKWLAWLLKSIDAIPINRRGVPVSAIRAATERVRSGGTIGLFPEGGVCGGLASVCRGGPIKAGVCMIAMNAQKPIVPVVIVGADRLCRISTWLPARRGRLWIVFGEPIEPPPCFGGRAAAASRRAGREKLREELQRQFVDIYAELCRRNGIDDKSVP